MSCCHCDAADGVFGERIARKDLARYRKRGPNATTRWLVDAVRSQPVAAAHLLDIGSGIGAVSQELLMDAAAHATLVDESSAYQAVAGDLAAERGTSERCTFVHGDFVQVRQAIPEVDLVTLDRVVCCYPEYVPLLSAVGDTGARWCALAYPRNGRHIRAVISLLNLGFRLRRTDFRVFVHPERRMLQVLEAAGFRSIAEGGTFVWRTRLMERVGPA
jgi:magnesium-protoporphyrin O-methyltransferase